MAMKIRKGDNVIVIAGSEKGKEGTVLSVNDGKVVVEGVNKVTKHAKANQMNPQGGIVEVEAAMDISNVALVQNGKPVKVGFKEEGGKKVRFNKKTGEVIK
jgi:large subunit ribosomal protein L24